MIKLETDLRSVQVTSKTCETTSYVYACYTRECPITKWEPHLPHDLTPYSLTLPTFVHDVSVKRLEPGVFYRLSDVACRSLGADESLSLIPLYVEISHCPYVDFVEDRHGCAYVPNLAADIDVKTTHLSRLCYGSWAVCGLLRTKQAREWAGLSDAEWRVHSLFNKARGGLDPSWQPFRANGSVVISFKSPLLYRQVEVYRETA
jgi:hypothetical protein